MLFRLCLINKVVLDVDALGTGAGQAGHQLFVRWRVQVVGLYYVEEGFGRALQACGSTPLGVFVSIFASLVLPYTTFDLG